jgi:putative SOS response-associated peptidase YedK
VRPLCRDVGARSDPGAVRVSRAAQLPAALQHCADAADRDRQARRRQAAVCAGALGLLPSWVKDPRNFSLLFNARGESLLDKPAFSAAAKRRRCLVPADGFYEWKAGTARSQPYFVRAKSGSPIAFAGLWETWMGPNGEELETATIVTTRTNRAIGKIHERMPVIVPPDAFDLWLDCANVDAATAMTLVMPAPETLVEAYEVSTAVNRVANDNPELVERWSPSAEPGDAEKPLPEKRLGKETKKDDGQGTLF